MGPVSASTAIDMPRERLFEMVLDLGLRPAFCEHFLEQFRVARLPSAGVGAAAQFHVSPPGFATWMSTAIEDADPPHRISERGRCGRNNRAPTFTEWELLEGPASLTTVTVTFWTEPEVALDRVRERLGAHRWYARRWKTALRRLARVAEGDEPARRVEVAGADRVPITGPASGAKGAG